MARFFRDGQKDHYTRLSLIKIELEEGGFAHSFAFNGGRELVTFERLMILHKMIGKALESEADYNEFKEWFNNEKFEGDSK